MNNQVTIEFANDYDKEQFLRFVETYRLVMVSWDIQEGNLVHARVVHDGD